MTFAIESPNTTLGVFFLSMGCTVTIMNKSDLKLGIKVSFSARHGEVVGIVTEIERDTIVVTSDLDQSHRYRVPMKFALESDTFRVRKAK